MAEARRLMAEDENEEENEMDTDMGGGGTDTNMDDGGDDSFMNRSAGNGDRINGSVPERDLSFFSRADISVPPRRGSRALKIPDPYHRLVDRPGDFPTP